MSHFLVTIGPALSIRGTVSDVAEGDSTSFGFSAVGGVGFVRLLLTNSTLPASEWELVNHGDATATLQTTSSAATPGTYTVRIQAVDDLRQPVERRYTLTVTAVPVVEYYLLLESGDNLLLESGDQIVLE